jgi:hypothetical protein
VSDIRALLKGIKDGILKNEKIINKNGSGKSKSQEISPSMVVNKRIRMPVVPLAPMINGRGRNGFEVMSILRYVHL